MNTAPEHTPGGGTDVMARTLAQSLTEAFGQTFVVDNKPGVSGNLSAAEVARATPDGYTLLVAPTSVEAANPSLFKSTVLPSRDLSPVMGIGRMQKLLAEDCFHRARHPRADPGPGVHCHRNVSVAQQG